MKLLYSYWRNDKDRRTQEVFFINIYVPLNFICKGTKGLLKGCVWEGVGDRTETSVFWPPNLWPSRCVFLVLLMLNCRPRGWLCWVLASFTASYQHLLWTPTHEGLKAPLAWCDFPYHISSITSSDLQISSHRNSTATNCLTSVLTELVELNWII